LHKLEVNEKERLVTAFKAANEAAIAADPKNDGGSCNFDTPVLRLPGVRQEDVFACATAAGIGVDRTKWLGPGYFVRTAARGQAMRRTVMAEAACKELKARGYDVMMYYQLD
jgi:hypothetical protein